MAQISQTSLFTDANLLAYYKLEDVSDSKGANTLTNNNTVTFTGAKFGNGANLGASNTNKSLSRAANLGINGNSDATFSFWINLLAEITVGTWELFVHLSQTGADRYLQLSYDYNAGTRRLRIDVAGTTIIYTITLGTTNFYHIVVTRNVGGNSCHLWVNGVDVANGTVGSTIGGANAFYLGANSASDFSSALYDDMGCFNRVLTSTEIGLLYNDNSGILPSEI